MSKIQQGVRRKHLQAELEWGVCVCMCGLTLPHVEDIYSISHLLCGPEVVNVPLEARSKS